MHSKVVLGVLLFINAYNNAMDHSPTHAGQKRSLSEVSGSPTPLRVFSSENNKNKRVGGELKKGLEAGAKKQKR